MLPPQNNGVQPKRNRQPAKLFQAAEHLRIQRKSYIKLKKNPNYKDVCLFNKGKKRLQNWPKNEVVSIEDYQEPEKFKDDWEDIQAMPERQTRSGKFFRALKPIAPIPDVTNPFAPLPEDAADVIRSAWTPSPNPGRVLFQIGVNEIRNQDLMTLKGDAWLNDEVINSYLELICQRNNGNAVHQRVYAFNTYFYENLDKGYAFVKRWTKKIDIFSYGIVFIPIHYQEEHWMLASINMLRKSIKLYDSLDAQDGRILQNISSYLSNESQNKKQQALNLGEWEIDVVEDRPTQDNSDDCGVFVCQFAEWISRGEAPVFTQANIPYYRQRMVYELMKKKLLL